MKQTRILMGMPISIEIGDSQAKTALFDEIYDYFAVVDERYSPYKDTSEVSQINAGLPREQWSREMVAIIAMCAQTKLQTNGYFNIEHHDKIDPSGLVKGWAIGQAADLLLEKNVTDFYIDAGGDIQAYGHNAVGKPWTFGIRSPFNHEEIIKVITPDSHGIATSGTYIRGQHIYNPHKEGSEITDIVSLTVVGPTIYDADRFATAAFAMGKSGLNFIESLPGHEGYMISSDKIATLTTGFEQYVVQG